MKSLYAINILMIAMLRHETSILAKYTGGRHAVSTPNELGAAKLAEGSPYVPKPASVSLAKMGNITLQ
jgi:hypothetical protein